MTMRTAVLIDDAFDQHDTGLHPENPQRHRALVSALADLERNRPQVSIEPATDSTLALMHDTEYIRELAAIAASGGGWVDSDTMVGPDSVDTARMAAGAAATGVDVVHNNISRRAVALGRPPGHHATPNRAMGFCLFNSVGVAAAHARRLGYRRVAIIDWDVHHGNGTQAMFESDPDVWYASIHQSPLFPGTGATTETGIGAGEGTICNVPVPAGSGDPEWTQAFDTIIAPFVDRAQPDFILLSAGFDAHRSDPIGGCNVTAEGFRNLIEGTCRLADRHCNGKLVAVLEGGYDPDTLAKSVMQLITVMDAEPS